MEVNVNGEYIELGDSSPAITKKSIDINNPSVRFLDFTNKFQLPYTNKNARIFDNPSAVGSDNRSLDKLYNVSIEDVFKLFSGKGFLESANSSGFNLQVVDSSFDLFKSLEKGLNKINWDDKDLLLTTASIDANDAANLDSCWIWNKVCLHENALQINTDLTTGNARCKYSRPSFYVQSFLKRAIELAGYVYSPSNTDLAFSACHSSFFFTSYQKTFTASAFNPSGSLAITGLNVNDFSHADLTVSSGNINIAAVKTKFRLRGSVTSSSVITLVIRATDNLDPTKVSESKLVLAIGMQDIDFSSSEFQSKDGYTIDLRLEGTGAVSITALLYTLVSDKDRDLSLNHFLGYKIKVYDNLPDLTYLDLFKLICVVGNEFQQIDNFQKVFAFGSLANISKLNTVDWSDKFIIGSEQVTAQFSGVYQKNWLKYNNDATVNPELGWSYFNSDNESLQKEGDYISLKFGASNAVSIAGNDIAHLKIYNDTGRIPEQTINIRVFAVSGSRLTFTPISWLNITAYTAFFNSLFRIRAIEADVSLSKLDFLKWHQKQLVYIDYFKTTFLVLEISNFIPGRKTKVKLLGYGR